MFRQITEQLARFGVEDLRSDRDPHHDIRPVAPSAVGAFAVSSILGDVFGIVAQMEKRIERTVGFEPNIPPTTAVASRWTTARHILFAAESGHAIASATATNPDFRSVYEHKI
jgi:hypothetical protein